jgi:hypothetical protein
MENKVVKVGEHNQTWFRLGAFCLYFAFPAAISAFAQQDESSVSPRQAEAALWDSSTTQAFLYTPMTRQERWQDYKHQNFESYGAFFQAFFTGLGDYSGRVPRWDSGMTGLSEHVGSEFASFTIAGTIHSSLAATLHQDTRYFHCSCRGGLHRTLHAASRSIFTYGDNGRIYPDVSGLAGIYGASMLTTEWYPQKYTATGYGVRQANVAVGVTSAIYVIREFSPEIKRAFHNQKHLTPAPGR